MNTSLQIKIDEWIVRPLINVLNLFVIGLGKILNIDHCLHKQFKTVAVCKYKGMGSIIQASPLLKNLRNKYPDAKIIFITTSGNNGILKKIKYVDEIIALDDTSFFSLATGIIPFIIKLIKSKIEVYIDLEVFSNFSTLVTILSMAKNRLGFYLQSKHYRFGNYTHMMYHNTRSPIMETYLQFARLLGCKIATSGLTELTTEVKHLDIAGFKCDLPETGYIVVNPNASDLRLERRWGEDKYNTLIKHILDGLSHIKIIVIGGKTERGYTNAVIGDIKSGRLINVAGKTSLEELIAIIKYAKLVITNDSGPMHIAFACQTPTISLFGPCSPSQYGNHKTNLPIYSNCYCSPCIHDFINPPCKGNNICMQLIQVGDVLKKVEAFFGETKAEQEPATEIIYHFRNITIGTLNR